MNRPPRPDVPRRCGNEASLDRASKLHDCTLAAGQKEHASRRLLQISFFRLEDPDGSVVARLLIEGAEFWLGNESPEQAYFSPESPGESSVRVILTAPTPDVTFAQALAAGASPSLFGQRGTRLENRPRASIFCQKVKDTPPPTRCWRKAPLNTGPTNNNVALSSSTPLRMFCFDLVQKSGCEVRVSR